MLVIDTNVLIRFFTKDIADQSEIAKNTLDSNEDILIPEGVFPEIEYVLGEGYSSTKEEIVRAMEYLISKKNIIINPEVTIAVNIYKNNNLDFVDCLVAAYALNNDAKLVTFDKKLQKLKY